jgi:hypothetical protein
MVEQRMIILSRLQNTVTKDDKYLYKEAHILEEGHIEQAHIGTFWMINRSKGR